MSEATKPVVVVGSINIDLVANAHHIPTHGETVLGSGFHIHPGGKGANQAVAVARLGYPVHLIGRVGTDAFGAQLLEQLAQAGVNTTCVATTPGSSGIATIIVAENGDNCIVISSGANAQLSPRDLDANIDVIRSAGIVLTQLETPLDTVKHLARICTREEIPLMLDPAPARSLPRSLLEAVTWLTPNETEAAFFVGDHDAADPAQTAQLLISSGVQSVVLKLGSRGAYLASPPRREAHIPPFQVQAVDTTAAGDTFNGAFAVGLLLGKGPLEGARFATAAAALSVTRPGAQPSMPSRAEVDLLLKTKEK